MVSPEAVLNMTDEEFARRTCELISKEFGLSGLARYIASRPGKGDYTAERQEKPQPSFEQLRRDLEAFQGSPLQ